MKPKSNYKTEKHKANKMDQCQTPYYALDPLLPYLDKRKYIWEPFAGVGHLADALMEQGYRVHASELEGRYGITYSPRGHSIIGGSDFFLDLPREDVRDVIVSNPPYGVKYAVIERCYELGKPFALLLPVETLGAQKAQKLFKKYGIQVIFMDKRVDFIMSEKGLSSSAQFPVSWFCWGLELPSDMVFVELVKPPKKELIDYYAKTNKGHPVQSPVLPGLGDGS